MKPLIFLLAQLFLIAGTCLAEDNADLIEYYGVSFRIPAPEGFERFDETYPKVAEPIRRAAGLSTDLLSAYATRQEILDRDSGKSTHFKMVFQVSGNKEMRSVDLTTELFDQIKAQFQGHVPDISSMAAFSVEGLNDYLRKEQNPGDSLSLKEPHIIGTFDDQSNSISLLVVSKVELTTNGNVEDFTVVVVNAFVNLNHRLISLTCGGEYHDASTIETIKAKLLKWKDQIISLNPDKP